MCTSLMSANNIVPKPGYFSHNEYLFLLVLETDMPRIKTQKNPLLSKDTFSESEILFLFLYVRKYNKEKSFPRGLFYKRCTHS